MSYPRPRARGKPLIVPPFADLMDDIEGVRARGVQPAAIVSDIREWRALKKQPGADKLCTYWPGGEEAFDGVPVILRRGVECVKVARDQDELNDLLLGPG